MARLKTLIAIGLAVLTLSHPAQAQKPASQDAVNPTKTCESLASGNAKSALGKPVDFDQIQDAPTHIFKAGIVPATGDVPAFCNAEGYISSNVGIEIHMPVEHWNGKFAMAGCGGMCGGIQPHGCDVALIKGYSCIFTDMGHKGTQIDAEWAYNNLQLAVDFGYRATHVTALAGKAITEAFYGKAPRLSYYMGCSTGGRQGYVEAQRFPEDFNGILAGSPPLNEIGDGLDITWTIQALAGADGNHPLFKAAELDMVTKAVIAKCDMDDGVKDGVVGDPSHCDFDPQSLVCKAGQKADCLTKPQADALVKVYAGPHDSKGKQIYFGIMPGSEPSWPGGMFQDDGENPHYKSFMTSMFRFLDFLPSAGPSWDMAKLDWDVDPKRIGLMEALFTARNPDLRAFKEAGGKMISFHGWNDYIVQPGATVDYYQTLEKTMGGRAATQDFFRLFMVSGLNHCQNGTGAYAADYFGALEDWVEHGKAPDRIIAARPKDPKDGLDPRFYTPAPSAFSNAIFTRPLFPYPLRAVYKGAGDPNSANSFEAK